jgi:hypothetical protein
MSEQPNPVDMHHLTFDDKAAGGLPEPPGVDDVMVARSYRLPVELDQWIIQTASTKGVKPSTLVRDLLELGRAAVQETDRKVSLADVLRALASVRSPDAA